MTSKSCVSYNILNIWGGKTLLQEIVKLETTFFYNNDNNVDSDFVLKANLFGINHSNLHFMVSRVGLYSSRSNCNYFTTITFHWIF